MKYLFDHDRINNGFYTDKHYYDNECKSFKQQYSKQLHFHRKIFVIKQEPVWYKLEACEKYIKIKTFFE